jgi:hypothetical protein
MTAELGMQPRAQKPIVAPVVLKERRPSQDTGSMTLLLPGRSELPRSDITSITGQPPREKTRSDTQIRVDTRADFRQTPVGITQTRVTQQQRRDVLQDLWRGRLGEKEKPLRGVFVPLGDDAKKPRGDIFYAHYRERVNPVATFGEAFLAGSPGPSKIRLQNIERAFVGTSGSFRGEVAMPQFSETIVQKGRSAPPWDIVASPERRRRQRNLFEMEDFII